MDFTSVLTMATCDDLIIHNRRLFEFLNTSRSELNHETKTCDLNDTFDSLLDNIKECHYIDFPTKEFLPSTKPNQTTMSIIHINIRSLNKPENFEVLHEFLTLLPYFPDIVCVLETRLKGNPLINISLPDNNFVHSDSVTNAGGVAVYVSTKYKFKLDCDLEMKLNGCEELWLNIKTNDISNQKFTVGVIYRHPNYSNSTVKEFSEALCNFISKITNRKDTFYLLGNLNIDLTVNKRT